MATIPKLPESAWDEAEQKRAFWEAHFDEYLHRYANQFVAVRDGQVVATSGELGNLVALLGAQGLDVQTVWVRYVTEPCPRIL